MKNSQNSSKANTFWGKALALHRRIKNEVEMEWILLKSIQGARIRRSFTTYMLAAPIEFILLALFLIPIMQEALLELIDDDHWMVYVSGGLIVLTVMGILHFLVSRTALLFEVYRPDEAWAEEYAPFADKHGYPLDLVVPGNSYSKVQQWIFGILTLTTFIGLAYLRTYILVTGYEHIDIESNMNEYLLSAFLSLIILGVLLYTVPGFNIGCRLWVVDQKYRELRRQRDNLLMKFRKEATIVEERMERSGDYFAPINSTEEDLICLERLKKLRQDDGSLYCLLPRQSMLVQAYFEGVPAVGLQIRARTREQIPLTAITDTGGKAELKWAAFDRNLAFLAVGNKEMYDINVPERIPMIIELTTPNGSQPPRLEKRA